MLIQEKIIINGKEFIHSYSDSGFMIHGGSPEGDYSEAYDPAEFERTYIETNIPVDQEENID